MAKEKSAESKQCEKFDALKDAVMCDSPDGVSKMLKSSGELEFTALALGLACRYRGLDMVRALVEGGAKFIYDYEVLISLYKKAKRNIAVLYPDDNFAAALLDSCGLVKHLINTGKAYNRPVLPINDRLRVLAYLIKTADKTGFDGGELLFFSILSGEEKITDHLKKHGFSISQKWVDIITNGNAGDRWLNYCWLVRQLPDEEFIPRFTAMISEIGECKLHITELFWQQNKDRFDDPRYLKFLLENFDLSKMNKTMLMKEIILREDTECLEIIANDGWLKMPKKRDEMIAFAAEKNKTECTAWLLDFKNRTADLAAERARAEKKAQRELNAAPDSVTALKPLWSYKKREDGSIIITGYKGNSTEITVPAKIGKNEVKAIGKRAFSPNAPRLTPEASDFRRKMIVKITLPDSVCEIGAGAFDGCLKMCSVNIPYGVTEIGEETFCNCVKLEKLEIPDSVRTIGEDAFLGCETLETIVIPEGVEEIVCDAFVMCRGLKAIELPRSLKTIVKRRNFIWINANDFLVTVPRGSVAEKFCKDQGYRFTYKEDV